MSTGRPILALRERLHRPIPIALTPAPVRPPKHAPAPPPPPPTITTVYSTMGTSVEHGGDFAPSWEFSFERQDVRGIRAARLRAVERFRCFQSTRSS